jgi:hypothetical protein
MSAIHTAQLFGGFLQKDQFFLKKLFFKTKIEPSLLSWFFLEKKILLTTL